jgi:hypothetical protein
MLHYIDYRVGQQLLFGPMRPRALRGGRPEQRDGGLTSGGAQRWQDERGVE